MRTFFPFLLHQAASCTVQRKRKQADSAVIRAQQEVFRHILATLEDEDGKVTVNMDYRITKFC